MRRIVFTKTVFVPSMTFSRLAFIIGIVHNAGAGRSVVNHPVSAVQNRQCIRRPAVIQVLTENSSIVRLAAIQQVCHFPAFELLGGFGSCAVQLIGFAFSEVIAVCNRFLISASYPANFACAHNGSDAVAVCNCPIITASYPANVGVALYRAGIITVLDSSDIFSADTGNILVTAEIGIFQADIPDFAAFSHTENANI